MQPEPSWRAPSLDLPFQSPPGPLYRIARSRNSSAWTSPDWSFVADDGTFGNRFDDADGYFRVIYAGSSPLACFVETPRPLPATAERARPAGRTHNIENAGNEQVPFATVPASWVSTRILGKAVCTRTRFAHVYSSEWLSYLRRNLEPGLMAKRLNAVQDFDLALLGSQDRRLTSKLATVVYQLGYDGIYYQSRHGIDLHNWALFEPFELTHVSSTPISSTMQIYRGHWIC